MASKTYEVWTKSKSLYYIKKDDGSFYVRKPGYGNLGKTSTLEAALAIVKSHSGSEIRSID